MRSAVFFLGLATLLTHELDAISNHEWHVLPLVRVLPDETGRLVFVLLHIPIYALVIAMSASLRPRLREGTRLGVAAFLMIHGGLHLLFSGHPGYEFQSTLSSGLIFGGAALGVLYLILTWQARERR